MIERRSIPVTVCMIVKNEADRLPRSLPPLRAFSEVLIFDTGSTDGTPEVIRALGFTPRTMEWRGFSKTRADSFRAASEPWILWLDADEELSPEVIDGIREAIASRDFAAHRINREMCFQGKRLRHGEGNPDYCTRLFRADAWTMPDRAIHESLVIDGPAARLRGKILHHSYRDWADFDARSLVYRRLWVETAISSGKRAYPLTPYARGAWSFLKGYGLKLGFLDGATGLRFALRNARNTFAKYAALRAARREGSAP